MWSNIHTWKNSFWQTGKVEKFCPPICGGKAAAYHAGGGGSPISCRRRLLNQHCFPAKVQLCPYEKTVFLTIALEPLFIHTIVRRFVITIGHEDSVGLTVCIVYISAILDGQFTLPAGKGGQQQGALRRCTVKSNFDIKFWPSVTLNVRGNGGI
jgi:hypothetical protein